MISPRLYIDIPHVIYFNSHIYIVRAIEVEEFERQMALVDLAVGALMGLGATELYRTFEKLSRKPANFKQQLTQLETTIRTILPHLHEICEQNQKFNQQDEGMIYLLNHVQDLEEIILQCSKVSSVEVVKKGIYSGQLGKCKISLLNYIQTVLPLDQYRDNKELLFLVREMHQKLVADKEDQICNQTESRNCKDDKYDEEDKEDDKYDEEEEEDKEVEDN